AAHRRSTRSPASRRRIVLTKRGWSASRLLVKLARQPRGLDRLPTKLALGAQPVIDVLAVLAAAFQEQLVRADGNFFRGRRRGRRLLLGSGSSPARNDRNSFDAAVHGFSCRGTRRPLSVSASRGNGRTAQGGEVISAS